MVTTYSYKHATSMLEHPSMQHIRVHSSYSNFMRFHVCRRPRLKARDVFPWTFTGSFLQTTPRPTRRVVSALRTSPVARNSPAVWAVRPGSGSTWRAPPDARIARPVWEQRVPFHDEFAWLKYAHQENYTSDYTILYHIPYVGYDLKKVHVKWTFT